MADIEYVDIVDEFDQVVAQATRDEVHNQNLRHRASHLLIFNMGGKIFLQKRSLSKAINPGCWDTSVGGHVNAGETYDECICRETEEELGVELIAVPTFLFKLPASHATGNEFVAAYGFTYDGPFVLNAEEITEGRWFALEEIDEWIGTRPGEIANSLLAIWKEYRNKM